jgi:hypothetical protein
MSLKRHVACPSRALLPSPPPAPTRDCSSQSSSAARACVNSSICIDSTAAPVTSAFGTRAQERLPQKRKGDAGKG